MHILAEGVEILKIFQDPWHNLWHGKDTLIKKKKDTHSVSTMSNQQSLLSQCHLLIVFANSLDQDKARKKPGLAINLACQILG